MVEGSPEHIKPIRLFELSQADRWQRTGRPSEMEQQHLQRCEECCRILEVFAREFNTIRRRHDNAA
jgi:hypothetical protein